MSDTEEYIWHSSATHEIITGCGSFYITIVLNDEQTRPIRILPHTGKAGGCAVETGILWRFALRDTQLSSYAKSINKVFTIDDIGERLYQYTKLGRATCQHGDMCCLHLITRMLFHYDLDLDKSYTLEEEEDENE